MWFDVHRCPESGERIPGSLISHVLTCLLLKLVEKDKDARLCCKGGIAGLSEIRKMPWFSGIDWKLLEAKKITPPMRPNVSLPAPAVFRRRDKSPRQGKGNFDPAHELEEILLEDNPLRAKRRTKDFDSMSPEMKRMEEQYARIIPPRSLLDH